MRRRHFKTVECSIMDIADDIAYATYDIEDALKAEFITPNQTLTVITRPNTRVLPNIVRDVTAKLDKEYPDDKPHRFSAQEVIGIMTKIFLEGFQKLPARSSKYFCREQKTDLCLKERFCPWRFRL